MAAENNIELQATGNWVTLFLRRHGFSLQRMTNLTTLTNNQLVQRAVDYMKYLRGRISFINLSKTLLMDETAVYLEDARTQPVDLRFQRTWSNTGDTKANVEDFEEIQQDDDITGIEG